MTNFIDARIITCGRECIALTALCSESMNDAAQINRLHSEFQRITGQLAERDFFGTISFSSQGQMTVVRERFAVAIKAYLRHKGGIDALLMKYDAMMAEASSFSGSQEVEQVLSERESREGLPRPARMAVRPG